MSPGILDERYFTWLYSLVHDVKIRRSRHTHWDLLRKLFTTEFAWFIPNDDNRAEDGRELRLEWVSTTKFTVDPHWAALGCSFLEMLIGLSRRIEFQTDKDAMFWFWHLMENIGLADYHDCSQFLETDVEDKLAMVMWRTYDSNGNGGLFPLRNSYRDQRQIEIWYQLSEYLLQMSEGG